MTILSNLAAILTGSLATILDLQLTWLLIRFNLVKLDFLTPKHGFSHQNYNFEVNIKQFITILSNLAAILAAILNWSLIDYQIRFVEKVYFRSQILGRPSIGEYWNIFGVPVLPENVIFTFFRACWCYSQAYNTGMQEWFSIVQYSCTSIWDLKFTFSRFVLVKLGSLTPKTCV